MRTNKRNRREARRIYRACLVDGALDEGRARRAARWVVESKRRGSLAILSHFARLVRLDLTLREGLVESAAPLPPDVAAEVEAGIARRYGAATTTTFVENPDLIGGMRVRVGYDVYDGSVRAALAALELRFGRQA